MIRMYVRSAGEDFAREVDRMGASWDVVIIQLAGIIEKCVIKATKRSNVWRCCTRVENGSSACDARTVQESDLQQATVEAINQLLKCSDSMMDVLVQNIKTALADDNTGELDSINELLSVKQRDLVRLAQAKKDYTILADEIDRMKEKK